MKTIKHHLIVRVMPFNIWSEESVKHFGISLTSVEVRGAKAFNWDHHYNDISQATIDFLPDVILLDEDRNPASYDSSLFKNLSPCNGILHLILHKKNLSKYKTWAQATFPYYLIKDSTEQSLGGKTDQLCKALSSTFRAGRKDEYHFLLTGYVEGKQNYDHQFLEDKLELLHGDQSFFQELCRGLQDEDSTLNQQFSILIDHYDIRGSLQSLAMAENANDFKQELIILAQKIFEK